MKYGSVCSGIEAATAAWHHLGWGASFFSEIEKFPRAVLAHHYPNTPLHGDFTTIEAGQYEPIDLLVGGTPCQSFSVAGLRGGLADERGNLALEYLRLAQRLRPRWLVWENVPGVLSSDGGRDFGAILGGMVELGYGIAYRVLDAQYFGVPQRRRRVFLVGYLGDWRRAAAVLFERASLRGDSPPRRKAQKDVAGTIGASLGGCDENDARDGRLIADVATTLRARDGAKGVDSDCTDTLIAAFGGNNQSGPIDVATALNAHGGPMGRMDFESETFIAHALRAEGFDASEDGTGRGTPIVPVAFSCKDHGADAGDIPPTLRAMNHTGSHPNAGGQLAIATSAVRRLTPRECERLQGFPDDFTAIPYRGGVAADGPRYKALRSLSCAGSVSGSMLLIVLFNRVQQLPGDAKMTKITMKSAKKKIETGAGREIVWYLENEARDHRLPGGGYLSRADALTDPRLSEFPGYKPFPFLVVKGKETVWVQGTGRAGNQYRASRPVYGLIEIAA